MLVWFWFCSARQLHAHHVIEQKQRSAAPKAALARFLVPTFKAENNQAVGVHASTHPAAHRAEACFITATIASCISIPHVKQGRGEGEGLFKTPSICRDSRLILPRRSDREPLRKGGSSHSSAALPALLLRVTHTACLPLPTQADWSSLNMVAIRV